MPNDPENFNTNGINKPNGNDDFIDSSFAVQFKPGDKTESIADKLKETKENIEKKSTATDVPTSRFDFNSSDSLKDSLNDEFDNFEFDSSISAFKPINASSQTSTPVASPVPAEPKPKADTTTPVFPKDGGTFDRPATATKAPQPSASAVPNFADVKGSSKPADEKLFNSGNGLDFATSERDKKTSPFMP